jgi:hypothetical protein
LLLLSIIIFMERSVPVRAIAASAGCLHFAPAAAPKIEVAALLKIAFRAATPPHVKTVLKSLR